MVDDENAYSKSRNSCEVGFCLRLPERAFLIEIK
jgi:hypothetical protein